MSGNTTGSSSAGKNSNGRPSFTNLPPPPLDPPPRTPGSEMSIEEQRLDKVVSDKVIIMRTPLPLPGTPQAPCFTGSNISEFLETWEVLCQDYGLPATEHVRRLPSYCIKLVGDSIKALPEYIVKDWESFKERLLSEYLSEDESQKIYSRDFLERFKNEAVSNKVPLAQYCRQYRSVANVLMERGQLSNYEGCLWFLQGLDEGKRSKVAKNMGLKPKDPKTFKMMEAIEKASELSELDEGLKFLRNTVKDTNSLEALVKSRSADPLTTAPEQPVVGPISTVTPAGTSKKSADIDIDALAKSFGNLMLPLKATLESVDRRLEQNLQQSTALPQGASTAQGGSYYPPVQSQQQTYQGRNAYPQSRPQQGYSTSGGRTPGVLQMEAQGSCNFCLEWGHYRRDCPHLGKLISDGAVHINANNRIAYGREGENGAELPLNQVTKKLDQVYRLLEERQRRQDQERDNTHGANFFRLSMDSDSDLEDGDEEPYEYLVMVGSSEDAVVMAASQDTPRRSSRLTNKSPIQDKNARVVKQRAEKEKGVATPKTVRTGEYVSPYVTSIPEGRVLGEDEEMIDSPETIANTQNNTGERRVRISDKPAAPIGPPKEKNVKLADILKQAALDDPSPVLTKMLRAIIPDVTVGDILTSGSLTHKMMFKPNKPAVMERLHVGDMRYPVQSMRSAALSDVLYSSSSPRIQVAINQGKEISALLDTGAEVNLIEEGVANQLGIPYSVDERLKLVDISNRETVLRGICENVEINLGPVMVLQAMLVVEKASQPVVLGMPYVTATNMKTSIVEGHMEVEVTDPVSRRTVRFRGTQKGRGMRSRKLSHLYPDAPFSEPALNEQPLPPQKASTARLSRRWDPEYILQAKSHVHATYKRKADKIQPVDKPDPTGENPNRATQWKYEVLARCPSIPHQLGMQPYAHLFLPRLNDMARGARLTPDRLQKLKIGPQLSKEERNILIEVLFTREGALGWDFTHIGRIRREVTPPMKIKTIEHTAWQAPAFRVPRAMEGEVIRMLRERMDAHTIEYCDGPYRNPWFLVKKSEPGKYRLINAAMYINKVTIRDANLPPNIEQFAEEFSGMQAVSLVDIQSGYDQLKLDRTCRDLTGFQTPLGLLRNCTIIQGGTNSVAQFCRVMGVILQDLSPEICRVFVDDIGIKGPRSDYGGEEVLPGVRRYILEAIQNLDKVIYNVELAGGCISGSKSQFITEMLKIVGFICGPNGRLPEATKVLKIVEWPPCNTVEEARAFIGICVYFRLWIEGFAMMAEPIYRLFKKKISFSWTDAQQQAMDCLKVRLTTAPAIQSIDYSEGAGKIILGTDASATGWGSALMQAATDGKRRHIIRYDSGIWSDAETKYDAGKRECRGLLKALKKVRIYLFGVHFEVETDARTLVAQLNRSALDVPGALVNRWLAWIRLFDFDVRHVSGKRHLAADGLSRRPWTPEDDKESEEDVEEFLDHQFYCIGVHSIFLAVTATGEPGQRSVGTTVLNPNSEYTEHHEDCARWLTTMKKLEKHTGRQWAKFKSEAMKYLVRDGELFRRGSKNVPLRRVVDKKEDQQEIIATQHDEDGAHKRVETTYRRVASMYWWEGLYMDCKKYCLSCQDCQRRSTQLHSDTVYSTHTAVLFQKVAIDVVKMPIRRGTGYLVVAREDLSGWVEARAIRNADSATVAKFLWEDVITRHGIFGRLVLDGGPENKKHTATLAQLYGIDRVQTSPYNPGANGMVERGHKPIVDSLAKLTHGGIGPWPDTLHLVLWADRTSIRRSTGMTPFQLIYGRSCVLPIEVKVPTWSTLPWNHVRSTADLLAIRSLQLLQRDMDLEEAALRIQRMREEAKAYSDERNRSSDRRYVPGSLVFLHDTRYKDDNSSGQKLDFWWLGPYKVIEANLEKGVYRLAELDGAEMRGTVSGRRLKEYIARDDEAAERYRSLLDDLEEINISEDDSDPDITLPNSRIAIPLKDRTDAASNSSDSYEEEEDKNNRTESDSD